MNDKNISITSIAGILGCFTFYIFFPVLGLFGINYEGASDSSIYYIYTTTIFSLNLAIYLYQISSHGINKREFYFYIFVLFSIFNHLLWVIYDPSENKLLSETLIGFIAIGLTGFLAASNIIRSNNVTQFIKLTDIVSILITIAIVKYSIASLLTGETTLDIGGTNYQFLSYLSALALGILLYNNYTLESKYRFKIFTTKLYFLTSHLFIASATLGAILGGGRGAFILVIYYFFSTIKNTLLNKSRPEKIHGKTKVIVLAMVIVIAGYAAYSNESLMNGFFRATEFITGGLFNDIGKATSGRDKVYETAVSAITQSPIIGYGPFNITSKVTYPHNFVIDILLQFGVSSILFLVILFYCIYKKIFIIKNSLSTWTLNLFIFPSIMLLFSGLFWLNSIFWYSITFIFVYKESNYQFNSN